MANYLTKEEIRQWRSSLEKITLEEFAARLGKSVEESKTTNDVVDIMMSNGTTSVSHKDLSEEFSAIAERAFKREQQISHTPFSINKKVLENNKQKSEIRETTSKEINLKEMVNNVLSKAPNRIDSKKEETNKSLLDSVEEYSANSTEINIVLKKSLTDREQLVFEYFLNNVGKIVFAKDLAELLNLPRDYVYKYIKNLRAKIDGNKLKNAPSGGFVLSE